jgi:proline iminopeptidase
MPSRALCIAIAVLAAAGTAAQERARELRVPVPGASLYAREIGRGQPMLVLHGGPDFDHAYLRPDLDRLADGYRLIYYDQRGAAGVKPEDVTLQSDVADLERVRAHFTLDAPVVVGHSWGTVLALEYALRYPTRVSRLVLMNPAPASAADVPVLRTFYLQKIGTEMDRQREIVNAAAYKAGEPEAVIARYRSHFKPALARPADYEKLMTAMQAAFVQQGKEGILTARAVEDRLMHDSWEIPGYDLMPKIASLQIPTLIIYGDHDFIPIEISQHIAKAMPTARLVTLKDCGHFSYLECPADVRRALDDFLRR